MSELETKRKELTALEDQIRAKQSEIDNFEYTATESEYDEWLDEMDGLSSTIEVCGCTFYPSDILKNCDPTAYRCGKSDYESEKDLDDVEEYADLKNELEELENEKEDLENEIFELEETEN